MTSSQIFVHNEWWFWVVRFLTEFRSFWSRYIGDGSKRWSIFLHFSVSHRDCRQNLCFFSPWWWTCYSLSLRWVYFAVGGLIWQSCHRENDAIWQQQANRCRGSSQCARPLVMMIWRRTAGVCHQALHPSQARTKHKAHMRWNVSSILVDEWCVRTKQDAICIHSFSNTAL